MKHGTAILAKASFERLCLHDLFLVTQFSACTLSIRGKPDTLNSSQTSVSLNYTAQTSVQLRTPYFISGSLLNDTTAWLFPVHLGEGKCMVFRDFFNPASMTWTKDLNSPFFDNFASTNILLSDGRVFMFGQNGYTIYSPSTQSWTDPQDLLINREYTDAQLLPNNKVFSSAVRIETMSPLIQQKFLIQSRIVL